VKARLKDVAMKSDHKDLLMHLSTALPGLLPALDFGMAHTKEKFEGQVW
jgi:hypothetical protein